MGKGLQLAMTASSTSVQDQGQSFRNLTTSETYAAPAQDHRLSSVMPST